MVRTKKFAVNDRVMCRATRFDDGVDGQGRKWSDNHFRKTKSRWVVGTVKRLLVSGQVKVKWDDEARQYESSPAHLIKWTGDESDSDDDNAAAGSDNDGEEGSGSGSDSDGDEVVAPIAEERNPEADMDDRADGDVDIGEASDDEGGAAKDLGDEVSCGSSTWKRVVSMGDDARGDRAKFGMEMKKMTVNSHTKRSDFWKELLPVNLDGMLEVAKENAVKHKDKGLYDKTGLLQFLCQLYGGCQFASGTDLWATEKKGMMPPPDFGQHGSKDKFRRWMRHLGEGPEKARKNDPWREVRWLIDGYNDNRRKTIKPSWLVVVDETMWAWTGQGMPHLSFVKRKPEPLGCEVKNLCDGVSGVMLFLEIQEGKELMERKQFCRTHKCTTATTLRLAKGAGLQEPDTLRAEDKPARVLVGDSWFASLETAKALKEQLGVGFIGNVKTAHKEYPVEQLRWDLAKTQRGDHVVYKLNDTENGEGVWAVGWNDHHYKTFIATSGITSSGREAKRARQNDTGQTFYKQVKRPKVMETYYDACGQIDLHNRHRQGQLRLEKVWKTLKWNNRLLVSILSSTMVDAFKAWEHHFPPATDAEEEDDLKSRLKEFVWRVIDEVCPSALEANPSQIDSCRLELIGHRITSTGKQEGLKSTIQERCTQCRINGRKEKNSGRAIRTSFRCALHRDVYLCNASKGPCLQEHMEEHGCV